MVAQTGDQFLNMTATCQEGGTSRWLRTIGDRGAGQYANCVYLPTFFLFANWRKTTTAYVQVGLIRIIRLAFVMAIG
uniref:Uncharacterized protein n=1 Tax=Trichuris muris TaxID=70415 RepID=A0A5S6R086_TRIMR